MATTYSTGNSRSRNSSTAIEFFEMPKSLISKSVIRAFLTADEGDLFLSEDCDYEKICSNREQLSRYPVSAWKAACEHIYPASWHHTGKFASKTDHYRLADIAIYLLGEGKNSSLIGKKVEKEANLQYFAIMVYTAWDNSKRSRPKFLGEKALLGIVSGDWFFYNQYENSFSLAKKRIASNSVVSVKKYETIGQLTKEYPFFKGQAKKFNAIKKALKK